MVFAAKEEASLLPKSKEDYADESSSDDALDSRESSWQADAAGSTSRRRLAFKIAVISLAALPTILLLLSWSPVHSSSKCRDFPEVHYESPGQTSLVEDLQTTGSQTSRARWYQTNWKRQRADPSAKAPEPLDFCIFENLCVDGRASATDEAPYYLLGDTASDASDSEAFKQIFRRCFKASYRKRESYGIRPASTHEGASVQWVKGNTFGFMKDEAGNHPAAWGREWAAFLPTMIHGGGILQQEGVGGNQFFDHVQLFAEDLNLNGWTSFVMNMAIKAARYTFPGHIYGSMFHPGSKPDRVMQSSPFSHTAPTFSDDMRFVNTSTTTCFEKVIALPNNQMYFQDADVADYFRKVSLESVGLPIQRTRACKTANLNAVYLKRERPLWNEDEVIQIMRDAGLTVQVASIDATTVYQSQVGIFANADILVSVHGSQLEGQMFMQPGSAMFELFPRLYFHGEQARLATMSGIDHVIMKKQPFPPRELVAAVDPTKLGDYDHVVELGKTYPTYGDCQKVADCYRPAREFGAYADPAVFKRELLTRVAALTETPGCWDGSSA